MDPVTTMQIYKGAIPFLLLQLTMVAILIAFPVLVTGNLDKKPEGDMEAIGTRMLQQLENAPGFDPGTPAIGGGENSDTAPQGERADEPADAPGQSTGKP